MTDQAIRSLVDGFVTQLESLIRKAALESIATSLGASLGEYPSTAGRASKRTAKAKSQESAKPKRAGKKAASSGGRRSAEQIDAAARKILAYVKSNPGARAEKIKSALGIPANHWALPIAKLLADKELTAKGQKRATEYFAKK